ncbi:putative relE [Escherichia coli 2-222-05_S1_C1]|nr:putative relE [Escherichia coli 2-222-05_S1_C1]KDX70956.1 putative relE [Escherichia coli 2-222-05_S1_C2]KDX75333.1 putative relE [Escherichia coli 2-222-05_S1_C3]
MTYTVKFRDDALKEWLKLDHSTTVCEKTKKMQRKSSYTVGKTKRAKGLLQN